MNRFRNYVCMTTGFAMLVLTVGVLSAGQAIAQAVRAAVVKNIGKKGRIPYQSNNVGTCQVGSNGFCTVNFFLIPAGKRLVIEHVSAQVNVFTPGVTVQRASVDVNAAFNPLPVQQDEYGATLNASVLLYADIGTPPSCSARLAGFSNGGDGMLATISGYLVDLSQ